jgi:hypothetical protein
MKPQEIVMVITIAPTQSWYTTSVPTVMGYQRAGTRITEDLHNSQTSDLSTKDLLKITSKA